MKQCSNYILNFDPSVSLQQMAEFQIYASPSPKRIGQSPRSLMEISPNRFDADFYRRKAERMEQDLLTISDQLNKARIRLRRAEDYQIKFDLLYKQKSAVEQEKQKKEREIFQLRAKNEQLMLLLKQRGERGIQSNHQKMNLLKQVEIWKERALEAEERSKLVISQEQNRANQTISKELNKMKRTYTELQEEYKLRITRLSKQVQQKSTVDNTVFEKHQRAKKQKDNEIVRLQGVVQKNRQDFLHMVQQKNREIQIINNKFQQRFNDQISHLRKNMGSQDQKFKAELDGLRQLIDIKNREIQQLQNELKRNMEHHARDRDELNNQIKLLKEKIYERERENEAELYNMKERLTSLHAVDIDAMKTHYQQLIDGLREERSQLQQQMAEKDKMIQFQTKQFQRIREQLKAIIRDKDRIIEQLKQHQSSEGQTNSNQILNLQQSLTNITRQRQTLNSEYQANIAFLNQQINKLTISNQLKNNEIRELHEYIALLKKEHFQSLRELEIKWKNERREREAERERERDLREKVEEEFRKQEKLWRNKQRELDRDMQRERREKNKWILSNQKLQKQIERLFKQNGRLEQLCKNQMSKNQKTIISTGDSKRELGNQLQRQRIDLQAKKRLQVDQAKKQYQFQLSRLQNQNQRIQNQLTAKKIQFQKLQEQFKKISTQYKNIEKLNKQKLADYQKKMATMNSQILLTQNLYQNLIEAKSKVVKKE